MTLFLILACGSGSVALGPEDDTTGENTSDTGVTGDTGENGEDPEDPDTNPAEGDWDGELAIFVPQWDWEFCQGWIELQVDADGNLEGAGECVEDSDWGDWEMPMWIGGTVSDDGEIDGDVVIEIETRDGVEEVEARLSGQVEGDDMEFEFVGELPWGGGGGGGGGAMEFEGEGEATR